MRKSKPHKKIKKPSRIGALYALHLMDYDTQQLCPNSRITAKYIGGEQMEIIEVITCSECPWHRKEAKAFDVELGEIIESFIV